MASTSDLSPAERQRFIMNWLAEKPNISVSDIVRRFSVSEVTARHDLVSLESEGKLRRVRGGAVSLSRSNAISYPEERINVQVEAKEAIAATAATLVDDGDVLVIDIGTTAFYFTKALMDKRDITIITGDLAIANYASFNLPNASVVLLGGSVRKGHLYLAGALTLDCMSKLHADKAFVSADGFHPDHGFTVEHDFSAMIKHMYLTNSNQGYMMVDQGKFNKTSFYQSAQIDDLDGIIVDGDNEGIMTAAIESSRSHPKLYFAKELKWPVRPHRGRTGHLLNQAEVAHRRNGAVVCDVVGHVVGDRFDFGHGITHGHSRLHGGEHTQVVARIAKAKGALVASAAQILQRPRHTHALIDALGTQLAICLLGSLGKAAVNASPGQSGTAEANPTHALRQAARARQRKGPAGRT